MQISGDKPVDRQPIEKLPPAEKKIKIDNEKYSVQEEAPQEIVFEDDNGDNTKLLDPPRHHVEDKQHNVWY